MIRGLDRVALPVAKPELGLRAGDMGTVVHARGEGYEVGFVTLTGHTLGAFTLTPEEVRPGEEGHLPHVRKSGVA